MKKFFIVLSIMFVILFNGCSGGGGGSGDGATAIPDNSIAMKVNTTYELSKTSVIKKVSVNPTYEMMSNLETFKTTITLLDGEANCTECKEL